MPNKRDDPIDQKLIDLLYRIHRDEGSFRAMAAKAGVAPDVYARVARRASGMDGDSANRLAVAYGLRYGFTAQQLFQWLGLPQPDMSLSGIATGSGSATADTDPVPPRVRVGFLRTRGMLSPEHIATIEAILANQIEMLTRMAEEGTLPPTRYRAPDRPTGEECET